MNPRYFLLLIAIPLFVLSCRKDGLKPVPAPKEQTLLKYIVMSNLPSPYYYFRYDALGILNKVGFSSGLGEYDLVYKNGRLSEMFNTISSNNDRLVYEYESAGLYLIKIFNKA